MTRREALVINGRRGMRLATVAIRRPSLILAGDKDGDHGTGSGRSIAGADIGRAEETP